MLRQSDKRNIQIPVWHGALSQFRKSIVRCVLILKLKALACRLANQFESHYHELQSNWSQEQPALSGRTETASR